jgi:[ribosomal protein S5]-alanine N-acetyltransferase
MSIHLIPPAGLQTERLTLRPATRGDAPALLQYYLTNRSHLQPWEPLRPDDFYTLPALEQRLADMEQQMDANNALHLLLSHRHTGELLGECNFTNIVRGPFQACHLGFSIAAAAEGQGLMREALSAAITFVFQAYGLHRVMANYRPENPRSGQLLRRLGFEIEGKARAYLKINGEWADHILTSRINDSK